MLLRAFIFSPTWFYCISISCHAENNLQIEGLQSTLPALTHRLRMGCLPRRETGHYSSIPLCCKLLETAFTTDLQMPSLQMYGISNVFTGDVKVWHASRVASYLPKISRSNMVMNIVQLVNTLDRCNCPLLPKDKLQHAFVGSWCWGEGELALLKGPSLFLCLSRQSSILS